MAEIKEDMEILEIKEPPTKSVKQMVKVDVNCSIRYKFYDTFLCEIILVLFFAEGIWMA